MRAAKRLGLVVPSSNTVVEPDFGAHMPPEIGVHTARMHLSEATPEDERVMLEVHAPQAAQDLGTLKPDVVVFACTSAGAILGTDGEARLEQDLAAATGATIVSTNAAVAKALRARGARRVAVLSPYVEALNEAIAATLTARGFEVTQIDGLGITENFAIAEVEPAAIVAFAEERLRRDECDTLFVSCTNFRAAEAADELAQTFGVPVVTSNLATIELARRHLGVAPEAVA